MRRRQFLAGGATLLSVPLAGCGHPDVVLDLTDATAADVAGAVSITAKPGTEEYRVVTRARENGTATRRGRYDLFDDTGTVRVGDAFYDVSETRLGSSEVTVYEVSVDLDPATATPDQRAIAYDDLPETDRERLSMLFEQEAVPSQEGYDVGVSYGTAGEVGSDSVFVPEQRYDVVVRDGDRYRVGVDSRRADQAEYRYEVTAVASSVAAFADQVRGRYLFTLSGLSDAERAVVEEAIDGAYFEDTEAFNSVIDRLRRHEAVSVDDFYGTWLCSYEGGEYLAYAEW